MFGDWRNLDTFEAKSEKSALDEHEATEDAFASERLERAMVLNTFIHRVECDPAPSPYDSDEFRSGINSQTMPAPLPGLFEQPRNYYQKRGSQTSTGFPARLQKGN